MALHHLSSFNSTEDTHPVRRILQIIQANEGSGNNLLWTQTLGSEFIAYFENFRELYAEVLESYEALCQEISSIIASDLRYGKLRQTKFGELTPFLEKHEGSVKEALSEFPTIK